MKANYAKQISNKNQTVLQKYITKTESQIKTAAEYGKYAINVHLTELIGDEVDKEGLAEQDRKKFICYFEENGFKTNRQNSSFVDVVRIDWS